MVDKNAPAPGPLSDRNMVFWVVCESREDIKRSEILLNSQRSLMLPPPVWDFPTHGLQDHEEVGVDLAAVVADDKLCPTGTPSKLVRR